MVQLLCSAAGLLVIAILFSENKRKIRWKTILFGFALQGALALAFRYFQPLIYFFKGVASIFVKVLSFAGEGAAFLFGPLVNTQIYGFIFICHVLPVIVFFSALTTLGYHYGILQFVVKLFSWLLQKTLNITGIESLSAAGNVFLGQTEAPLLVKPFLKKASRSELFCIMVGGMATIAGSVMAAYIGFMGGNSEASKQYYAFHFLVASVLNAPAGIIFSKIIVPETVIHNEKDEDPLLEKSTFKNGIEALTFGAGDGLKLAANVGAMLLVFVAFMAMLNAGIHWVGNRAFDWFAIDFMRGKGLEDILGWCFYPFAILLGIVKEDQHFVAYLLGKKIILNEFVSYIDLSVAQKAGKIQPATVLICTYALCGFANFSSIGIQIGGIGTLAPNQKPIMASLGLRAILAGSLACMLSALWASFLFV